MRNPARVLLALGTSLCALAAAAPARADVSGWFAVNGGAVGWKQAITTTTVTGITTTPAASLAPAPALALDVGAGTTPDAAFIVGGLFRVQTLFGYGTDVALMLRGATRGFQSGGLGLAIDAGGYARPWGGGSLGFAGGLVLGVPLGFQISLLTTVGTRDELSIGAIAGIDLLRLTVFRRTMLDRWPNPSPASRRAGLSGLGLSF